MSSNKKLISIVGPTAIGKTSLSIKIAQYLNTEIISCDSRQFYKEMKIGTACPSDEELDMVPHHFIQNLSIKQDYSVGDFEREAIEVINFLFQKHDQLVMVGGSGLYEKAINEGLDEFPDVDPEIRNSLVSELNEIGIGFLVSELKNVDPEYYAIADLQNPMRVIRALEVFRSTGKLFSSFRKKNLKSRDFSTIKIGLEAPREIIYDRINLRVDQMMQNGLLEEVKTLLPYRHVNALQTVGYKELFSYLDGDISLDKAIEEIKKNSRRYAKRQLTWYRKDLSVHWFPYNDKDAVIQFIKNLLEK
ncbi:tRNA (adenosine(37)-N6)-dimethylallyltransferase MiaA [Apibacter muscae]|uniref:tRNA (adenosine(37)-N6)-dimethylallyltransferase MiaA n=1 Tax=Apibacter muscae TaxID=2509004 RepID=UPI001FE8FFD5|nr:tRNA (adenosine(37)-N6)-dimethylallyltransferase MiaA [Apibacter muscae]